MTLQIIELLSSSGTQILWLPADRKATFPTSTLHMSYCFWAWQGNTLLQMWLDCSTDRSWSINCRLTVGFGRNAQQRGKLTHKCYFTIAADLCWTSFCDLVGKGWSQYYVQ